MSSSLRHSGSAWYLSPYANTITSAGISWPLESTMLRSSTSWILSTLHVTLPALAYLKMPSLDCPARRRQDLWETQAPEQP